VTTFRSLTLVVAVLLLAGGALTGIHLLNTTTSAPVPAQLSTSDAGDRPAPAPVEKITPAPVVTQAPAGTGSPAVTAPAQRPAPALTDRTPASRPTTDAPDRTSDTWRDRPDGFPGRDQYPFRQRDPGTGNQPDQDRSTPTDRDRARQQIAYALCDRYHIPRERCQIEPSGH
jgi:hypothetical protein